MAVPGDSGPGRVLEVAAHDWPQSVSVTLGAEPERLHRLLEGHIEQPRHCRTGWLPARHVKIMARPIFFQTVEVPLLIPLQALRGFLPHKC
jgi:hypothetical protein